MKKWILRTLEVIVSLAMLLTALPASLALAAAFTVNIINTEGTSETNHNYGLSAGAPGDSIKIWGTGITGTPIDVYFSSQQAPVDAEIGDEVTIYKKIFNITIADGTSGDDYLVTTLEIPSQLNDDKDLHGGTYYVYIVNNADVQKNILALAAFQIVGISDITADKTSGPVGTVVSIDGEGYAPGEYVEVNYYHTNTSYITLTGYIKGGNLVRYDGKFNLSFAVPESTNGAHTVKVVGEDSQATESITFTVTPSVTLSATSGKSGDSVIVYAKGFVFSGDIDISIGTIKLDDDNSTTMTDKPDTDGSLSYIITIPSNLDAGTYDILVKDEVTSTINAKASFTVNQESVSTITPTITITQPPATITVAQTTNITEITTVTETKTLSPITQTQTTTIIEDGGSNDWIMIGILVVAVIIAIVLIIKLIVRFRY
jgi:hypothetical protein